MLNQKNVDSLIAGLIVIGALLCIFTPNYPLFKWWAHYAMQITLAYWLIGVLLLLKRSARLGIITFCSCALLCIYLKSTTNDQFHASPKTVNFPTLKIGHYNANAGKDGYSEIIRSVLRCNPDIVSLQEATPDWDKVFRDTLGYLYPYSCKTIGADVYSLALYSRFPFLDCDTFYCGRIPNLMVSLRMKTNGALVNIVDSYIAPPFYISAREEMMKQLDTIGAHVNRIHEPTITLGDYNIEAFSPEIIQFRNLTFLQDSRRGFSPIRDDGSISLTEVPKDFIFFNRQLKCIDFQTICGPQSDRLGIIGTYQINPDSLMQLVKGN